MNISDEELGPCKKGGIISQNGAEILFVKGLLVLGDNKGKLAIFLQQSLLTSLIHSLID